MGKKWGVNAVYILVLIILINSSYLRGADNVDLDNALVGVGEIDRNERKRLKSDAYIFSDNMLQISSQLPIITPFESLSLIWTSVSEEIKIGHKNEGALVFLYLVNPIYLLLTEDSSELEDANVDVEQFREYLSQIVYCLIQTKSEDYCESKINEFILLLNDQIVNEIQKLKETDLIGMEISLRINSLKAVLNKIKYLLSKEKRSNKDCNAKLYPINDSEKLLYNLLNIKNVLDYFVDLCPKIPYIKVLNPMRTLLDIVNKDWDIEKKNKVKSWFGNNTSPIKTICDEIISGIKEITTEIDRYYESKNIKKLVILTETKIYIDSLNQLCTYYNKYVNNDKEDGNNIPNELISIYNLFNNDREKIRTRMSKIYENSRKAVDINSNLCTISSDKKILSSENLTENEIYEEVSTTLLDMIGGFFTENVSDSNLQRLLKNNCPSTIGLINNNVLINENNELTELGTQIKTLSSILSLKRTHLASRMCLKIKTLSNEISYTNRRLISINRLLIPVIVDSSMMVILPSNGHLYDNNKIDYKEPNDAFEENISSSKAKLYVDPDKSCSINNSDKINYYIRETIQMCGMVNNHSSLFSSAIRKISNTKVMEQINHKLTKISQSQMLHEFREIARDIKGSRRGHFLSEIGNSLSFSLNHWYNYSKRKRRLNESRRLLRKAFYSYTASLDNVRLDLRPEVQEVQYNVLMMESSDIKILTSGDFVFLNSKKISNSYKKKYSKHTSKIISEYYGSHTQILKDDFQISADNIKELNSLIDYDSSLHREELDAELEQNGELYGESNMVKNGITNNNRNESIYKNSESRQNLQSYGKDENNEFDHQFKINVSENKKRPYVAAGDSHFVVLGRDSSSFSLCKCRIRGRKMGEMLQLFVDLLFQIRNTDVRITGYDMLSESLKKAVRQTLIIIVLNEFAVNLLPKVRKEGYQRFYRMKHSTHKALRTRVKNFIKEIKNDTYKLSIVLSTLNTLLLTAFNYFKYDSELDILRKVLLGVDVYTKPGSDEEFYAQDNSILKVSETIRRSAIEKLIGEFYVGRIRRGFGSLKDTVLKMMNPKQIIGLTKAFKMDSEIRDINLIVDKLYLFLKNIGPSHNCIGITDGQKLESFYSLC
ncbi:hypothetical protein FG386_001205 [Cryptosporidium ryanae]|uniref:uncharacterized protein n=1 Tax=Cryptosporidium ryanae TaxID=515981 RepID=UPI00351A7613|nr:hypothetical protein FG386_001205 [Cryptosporidium ryanae]